MNEFIYVLIGSWWIGKSLSCLAFSHLWQHRVTSWYRAQPMQWGISESGTSHEINTSHFFKETSSFLVHPGYTSCSVINLMKVSCKLSQMLKFRSIVTLNWLVGNNPKGTVLCIPLLLLSGLQYNHLHYHYHKSLDLDASEEPVKCSVSCYAQVVVHCHKWIARIRGGLAWPSLTNSFSSR